MVLGKLPVPGRPTIWITVGQGPTALAVGAGGGCLDIFTLIYPFFPLSPSLWETARYRLKYCLKGPLSPKPTNQPKNVAHTDWGADRKIILTIIQSKLDYGSIIYGSARKSYLEMLDPIHHQGLRLALGAFRTSPSESLLAEANEPSLYNRRLKLSMQYALELKSNPSNPTLVGWLFWA